jgi:hypothetical protein
VLGQVAGLSKTCSIQQRIEEEYRVFRVKEFKCLVMSELKQIRILSLKSLIVAFSSQECKEVL